MKQVGHDAFLAAPAIFVMDDGDIELCGTLDTAIRRGSGVFTNQEEPYQRAELQAFSPPS